MLLEHQKEKRERPVQKNISEEMTEKSPDLKTYIFRFNKLQQTPNRINSNISNFDRGEAFGWYHLFKCVYF